MNTQQPSSSSDIPSTSRQSDTNSLVQGLLDDFKYQECMIEAKEFIEKIDNATATEDEVIVQVLVAYRNKEFMDVKFYLSTNAFSQHNHETLRKLYRNCYKRLTTKWRISQNINCPLSIAEKSSPPIKIYEEAVEEVYNRLLQNPEYKINYGMLCRLTLATRKQVNDDICQRLLHEKKELKRWTYGLSIENNQIHIYPINGSSWSEANFTLCEGLLDEVVHNEFMPVVEKFLESAAMLSIYDKDVLIQILISYRRNKFESVKKLIEDNFFRPSNQEAMRELYSRCHRKYVGEKDQSMNENINFPSSIAFGKFTDKTVPKAPLKLPPGSVVVPPARGSKKPGSGDPSGLQPSKPMTYRDLAKLNLARAAKQLEQPRSRNVTKNAELLSQKTVKQPEDSEVVNNGLMESVHKKANAVDGTILIHPIDGVLSSINTHHSERSNMEEVESDQLNLLIDEEEPSNNVTINFENDTLVDCQPPEMEQVEAVEQEKLVAENQEKEKLIEVGRPSRTRKRTQPYESKGWRKYPAIPKTNVPKQKRGRGRPRKSRVNEDHENEPSINATVEKVACSSSINRAPLPEVRRNYQPRQQEKVQAQEPPKKAWPCYYAWLRSEDAKKPDNQEEVNQRKEPVEKRARLLTEEEVQDIEQGKVEHSTDYMKSWLNQVNNVPDNLELNDEPQNLALIHEEQEVAPAAPENDEVQDEPNIELPVEEGIDVPIPCASGNYEVMHERFAPIEREIVEEVVHPQVEARRGVRQEERASLEHMTPALEQQNPLHEVKMEIDDDQVKEVVEQNRPLLEHVEPVAAQVMIPNATPVIPDPSLPPRCGENYMLWTIEEMAQWIMAVSKSEETRDIFQNQGMDGESMEEFLCEKVRKDLNIMYFPWKKLARAAQQMIDNKPQ